MQLRANVARSPGRADMVLSRLPFPALSVHQPVVREAIRKHDEQEEKIVENPSVTITYKLASGIRICVEVSTSVKEVLDETDRKIRSQRRQDRRYLDNEDFIDGLTDAAMRYPQQTDAADLVIRMESYRQLYAVVDKLSEVQRRRLLLYFVDNLTHHQIAELEGVNRATISHSIKRALKQLYKHFTD